ncbi:MAG: transglycosylase SLT domain-containing protein [Acidobacteriia bacterium]|nr:transglycosylase SLT domain-containing protein [Terriglobia bacterium]
MLLCACRAAPSPTLAQAFQIKGGPATRAKAFMQVAIRGRESERGRAALLWGLFACDARAPVAGLTGFNVARPDGGRRRLAAHRLEEALEASRSPAAAWTAASRAPWLADDDRVHLRLHGAEVLSQRGETAAAIELLPGLATLRRDDAGRALGVVARGVDPAAALAQHRLAVEFPEQLAGLASAQSLEHLSHAFTSAEWAVHAQALFDAGQAIPALRAAGRAGSAGFVIAARASLRLHRPSAALVWVARGGDRCGVCWVERAEAQRQLAWGTAPKERHRTFGEMLRSAVRASQLLPAGDPARPRAELLQAEALVELGRFAEAAPVLAGDGVTSQPRFEWVCRRLTMLATRADGTTVQSGVELARSTRGRRLGAFWIARERARHGDVSGLEALATSGFPDLPAQWASRALGRRGVAVAVSEGGPAVQLPPAWAGDLMAVGRVADVVLGWRAELDASGGPNPGWLGLVRLAEMPPLEAISLLVRGEPRLLSGPWQGLPRELLERYLPLPLRSEVESAAHRAGVPPWVLAGLVRQESAWNPRARSTAGAVGLAQVLPGVAAEAAREVPGLGASGDLFDPGRNLTLGAALLARWGQSFSGSWTAALASYDAGEKRVRDVWEAAGRDDGPAFVEALEIPETWDYVHRVVLLAEGYRILYWPEGKAFPWT